MKSLADLLSDEERETMDELGSGRNELVFRCIGGGRRGWFFYVTLAVGR